MWELIRDHAQGLSMFLICLLSGIWVVLGLGSRADEKRTAD
jgi:hypothetical protein